MFIHSIMVSDANIIRFQEIVNAVKTTNHVFDCERVIPHPASLNVPVGEYTEAVYESYNEWMSDMLHMSMIESAMDRQRRLETLIPIIGDNIQLLARAGFRSVWDYAERISYNKSHFGTFSLDEWKKNTWGICDYTMGRIHDDNRTFVFTATDEGKILQVLKTISMIFPDVKWLYTYDSDDNLGKREKYTIQNGTINSKE